ncbi:MAG: hypothetical protein H6981_07145 [Gammaproteobacteria bacterium]|nr:hypothetical protein [Gammaproteobacteria bacterium]
MNALYRLARAIRHGLRRPSVRRPMATRSTHTRSDVLRPDAARNAARFDNWLHRLRAAGF